jgi:hypothetical protein
MEMAITYRLYTTLKAFAPRAPAAHHTHIETNTRRIFEAHHGRIKKRGEFNVMDDGAGGLGGPDERRSRRRWDDQVARGLMTSNK